MPYNEEAPDNLPLYVTVAATILYFITPFTIVLVLYLRYRGLAWLGCDLEGYIFSGYIFTESVPRLGRSDYT